MRTVALIVPAVRSSPLLGQGEDVVPQPSLEMAFHLGQVEERPQATLGKRLGVVEDEQPEVEQAAEHRLAVHLQVPLVQVPAAGADEQGRGLVVERVRPAVRR